MGLEPGTPLRVMEMMKILNGKCTKNGIEVLRAAEAVLKGKRKEEAGFFIDPYKFEQPQMVPMGLIRRAGDAPTPSWLGKFEKYEWAPPGII